jgi:hypothetical protein
VGHLSNDSHQETTMSKADELVQAFSAATKAIALRSVDSAELDPIFAAIQAHRKAFLECEGCGAEENVTRLSDIENDALRDLLEVTPTTLDGVVGLSRYAAELTALFNRTGWDRLVTHPDDDKRSVEWSYYIHRHVADAVLNLSPGAQS